MQPFWNFVGGRRIRWYKFVGLLSFCKTITIPIYSDLNAKQREILSNIFSNVTWMSSETMNNYINECSAAQNECVAGPQSLVSNTHAVFEQTQLITILLCVTQSLIFMFAAKKKIPMDINIKAWMRCVKMEIVCDLPVVLSVRMLK